jgi:hypothetical protein
VVGALLLLVAPACTTYRLSINKCPTARPEQAVDSVFVQYLGVGGFLIKHGGDTILTAPLYSNPSLIELLMDHEIRPDTDLIDSLLPPSASQATAILSGHSHFDHLMDVSYVGLAIATKANIYGSRTTQRLLAEFQAPLAAQGRRIVALDDVAWDNETGHAGRWVPIGDNVRLAAIRSEHSDQVTASMPFGPDMPIHLWRGKVEDADRPKRPRSGSEWAEGTVFAYVIDFLDGQQQVIFRIYYQDSGTNPPKGFIPAELLPPYPGGRTADLAILCAGGDFRRLVGHPRLILANTHPRYVVLAHWEDFFVTQRAYCVDRKIFGITSAKADLFRKIEGASDTGDFIHRVHEALEAEHISAETWLPCPTRSTFELPVDPLAGRVRTVKESYACPIK